MLRQVFFPTESDKKAVHLMPFYSPDKIIPLPARRKRNALLAALRDHRERFHNRTSRSCKLTLQNCLAEEIQTTKSMQKILKCKQAKVFCHCTVDQRLPDSPARSAAER